MKPKRMTILETHHLDIGYGGSHRPVAADLNLLLRAGELVCLIGPNGVGKSTLMRTLAAMQKPLAGQVVLDGRDIQSLKANTLAQQLSIVLTDRIDPALLTGYGLVALGRHPYTDWMGKLTPHDENVIRWAVESVSATHLAERQVAHLSDGERQKFLIARALAQEPAVMLLDEPTAYLDLPRRVEIMQVLRRIAHDTGRGVLLSTHDLDLALRTADQIWLMGQGGVIQTGAPEDLVLGGTFETVFSSEGVQFDPFTGSFNVNAAEGEGVLLVGEGLSAIWTRRALERAGFHIVSNGANRVAQVTIYNEGNTPHWQVTREESTIICDSLDALIKTLS